MNLICYLSNGYPTIADSIEMAKTYVAAGCDIIEIDFPARNPFLESEYLADRMAKSLMACDDYTKYMDGMIQVKKLLPKTQFILLAYEDTVAEIGLENFVFFCKENGFEDLIFVGLKNEKTKDKLIAEGIRVSCYVQYHMPAEEVQHAKRSNGFVYLQAKPTTNGVNPHFAELKECIGHLRAQGITRPIYCGVGIHTTEDGAMVKQAGADGIFVGSAILKLHDNNPALVETIQKFKEKC